MRLPETREQLSRNARAQWADQEYKSAMGKRWAAFYASNEDYRARNRRQLDDAQRAYWLNQAHRDAQAARTRAHFEANPEAREQLKQTAQAQWQDPTLIAWRREQTKAQWTPEFRAQRKQALGETYLRKSLAAMRALVTPEGQVDVAAYDAHRRATRDKSLLRFDRLADRYFGGDADKVFEAVAHYNHRVVSVERVYERRDVFDVEVPGTHNFALASGVFVHNSAKQGRDRHFQAILPLFGKIMNTERARLDKILGSDAIKALISAIGTGIGDQFNLENRRYDRIVLMSDADVDGSHIRTLLLTFFFRYMTTLVEGGHLYIAQPPLYRVETKKGGKEVRYCYSDAERDQIMNLLKARGIDSTNTAQVVVQRFKGLGEMNAEQLWETTMDPTKRTLLKVTVDDGAEADRTFDMLMGNSVPPRRNFITRHAREVRNLDV